MRPLGGGGYVAPINWTDQSWNDVLDESVRRLAELGLTPIQGDVSTPDESPCLTFAMGWRVEELLPHQSEQVVPLIYDAFPTNWKRIAGVIGASTIRTLLVTSRPSQRALQMLLPDRKVCYCAEAVNLGVFGPSPSFLLRERRVVEFGRRDPIWHAMARETLASSGIAHDYNAAVPGEATGPARRQEFIERLRTAAVSVCIPRAYTDPLQTGGLETMTCRYLESFAAGTLVLGSAPAQLTSLFGYNPVVEIDWINSSSQLTTVLDQLDDYRELVERNTQRVAEVGDWEARATELGTILDGV
ncbi:glycosyltransferase [Kribbella sp. DT2]|uniref:glycosyltransferase n=1 Tax=Kribbella sp. DT2 TaxID=3393427 RepID=UPI003CF4B0D9